MPCIASFGRIGAYLLQPSFIPHDAPQPWHAGFHHKFVTAFVFAFAAMHTFKQCHRQRPNTEHTHACDLPPQRAVADV